MPSTTVARPRVRDEDWMSAADWLRRHERNVHLARTRSADVVLYGASVVEAWGDDPGFGALSPAPLALGIPGDRTEHLLWRLANGEAGHLRPSVVVSLIGNNNLGTPADAPEDIAAGVAAVQTALSGLFPRARRVFLALLPCRFEPDDPVRRQAEAVNRLVLAAGGDFEVLDLGRHMVDERGFVPPAWAADGLHPTAEGYARLTAALRTALAANLRE